MSVAAMLKGWLFPAARKSGSGHISYSAISHAFLRARRRAHLERARNVRIPVEVGQ
jgi:hypothetical protein